MKTQYYTVSLTATELKLLDGKVNEATQKKINELKQAEAFGFDIPLMNEVLLASTVRGTFAYRFEQIRSCPYCDKGYSYHTYAKNSRSHKKGDDDTSKPMYYLGVVFNEGFIVMGGYGDICQECCEKHTVIERLIKKILDDDLKIELLGHKNTRYKKDDMCVCYSCGNEMYESEMGRSPCLMGGGTYPSTCPKCGTVSLLFGRLHKTTNRFRMVLATAEKGG